MSKQIEDQSDVLAANEAMTKQLAEADAKIKTLNTDLDSAQATIATLTGERDTAATGLTAEKAETARLTGEVTRLTAERDDWMTKAEPVQKQLATKLAKLGISDNAASASQEGDKPLTATEKCLAAKGK